MDSLTSSFTPPCVTQPPPCGHLLPKEGGIDTLKTPHILAPSSGRGCRAKRDGVGSPVCWKCVSPYRYPHHFRASPFIKIDAKRRTSVCKEDFSTSLEMTIRQKRLVFRRGVRATSKPISRLHMLPSHSVRRRQETDFPSPLPLPSLVRHGQACGPHRGSHS